MMNGMASVPNQENADSININKVVNVRKQHKTIDKQGNDSLKNIYTSHLKKGKCFSK
jgi:hypothetical protein